MKVTSVFEISPESEPPCFFILSENASLATASVSLTIPLSVKLPLSHSVVAAVPSTFTEIAPIVGLSLSTLKVAASGVVVTFPALSVTVAVMNRSPSSQSPSARRYVHLLFPSSVAAAVSFVFTKFFLPDKLNTTLFTPTPVSEASTSTLTELPLMYLSPSFSTALFIVGVSTVGAVVSTFTVLWSTLD